MSSTMVCAIHPELPTSGACERCGTFGCSTCLSLYGTARLCQACAKRGVAALPRLEGRALVARLALYAVAVLHPAFKALSFFEVGPLGLGLVALPYLASMLAAMIGFLIWFHLAVRWGTAVGRAMSETPAFSVASFFIPFLNFVLPYRLARQMSENAPVTEWQGFWLGSQVVGYLALLPGLGFMALVGGVMGGIAAFLAARVVQIITRELTNPIQVNAPALSNQVEPSFETP